MATRRRRLRKGALARWIILLSAMFIIGFSMTHNALASMQARRNAVAQRRYYVIVIQSGDTLWDIATEKLPSGSTARERRAYIKELKKINKIYNERALRPGGTLLIYE